MVAPLLELGRRECIELLERERIGRLAVTTPGGVPVIRPLNYLFDRGSQSIVFRVLPGAKLYALRHARQAVFEIDGVEPDGSSAWSVVVRGVCEEITSTPEVARLERLGLESWAGERARLWFRIRASVVRGRRLAR